MGESQIRQNLAGFGKKCCVQCKIGGKAFVLVSSDTITKSHKFVLC